MENSAEVNQKIRLLFQTADLVLNVQKTYADIIKTVVAGHNTPNSVIKAMNTTLNKEIEAGRADILLTEPDAEKLNDIRNQLMKRDIYCQVGIYKGKGVIITLTNQREAAQRVLNKYQGMDSPVVSPKEIQDIGNGEVMAFKVDTEEQALLIQKRCAANHVPVNIAYADKGLTVRYAAADKEVMEQIKRDTAIDFAGEGGKIVTRQLQWENDSTCNTINAAINKEIEQDSYVVDRQGNYLKFNRNDVEFYDKKQDTTMVINKTDKDYGSVMNEKICSMDRAVLMSKEQFEQTKNLSGTQREDAFLDIEQEQGRPVPSASEIALLQQKEHERVIMNQKLNQDHPEEVLRVMDEYNPELPLVCYKESERVNYETSHDRTESQYQDASILDDARALEEGMIDITQDFSIDNEMAVEDILEEQILNMGEQYEEPDIDRMDVMEPELD